jgi:2,4-dienoyl-CoA reductase-like NADH-dependent reductase (Old Yellow Enzyme family)
LKHHPALSVVQLCNGGLRAIPALTGIEAHSASAYDHPSVPGFVRPRAFSVAQIEQVIEDFAQAAERAARAGFGGVESPGPMATCSRNFWPR